MLVKVSPNLFINPNHVAAVQLTKDGATVTLTQGHSDPASILNGGYWFSAIDISTEAAGYLLEVMETASAVTLPGEPGYVDPNAPSTQPLTSQIAVLLRDTFPQGATIDQLMGTLHLNYHLIRQALDKLSTERVAVTPAYRPDLYFHAQHAPRDYTPEPERDLESIIVPPDSTAFATGLRNGEFQCVECKHQSCAMCVVNNACCNCNGPSFTLHASATPSPDLLVEPIYACPFCKHIICNNCSGKAATPPRRGCCQCGKITPTRDLLVLDEALELNLEEDNEKKEDRSTEY